MVNRITSRLRAHALHVRITYWTREGVVSKGAGVVGASKGTGAWSEFVRSIVIGDCSFSLDVWIVG